MIPPPEPHDLLKMDKKEDNVIDTDVSDVEAPQKRREYAMAR